MTDKDKYLDGVSDTDWLADKCPNCHSSLLVGSGGWITCSGLSCKTIGFKDMIEHAKKSTEDALKDRIEKVLDLNVSISNAYERIEAENASLTKKVEELENMLVSKNEYGWKAVDEITSLTSQRDKIRQIVIEDVPHKYQERLLKVLEETGENK